MASRIAERVRWAVEALAVAPSDHLLEIGCGHGVAVSLVCEKLAGGTITAIDRSAVMIGMAKKRNRGHIAAGRAVLRTITLEKADLGEGRFDKVFAFHVGLFWKEPSKELGKIARSLRPGGALYLFNQPLAPAMSRGHADQLTMILRANHFSIREVLFEDLRPTPAFGVVAEPG